MARLTAELERTLRLQSVRPIIVKTPRYMDLWNELISFLPTSLTGSLPEFFPRITGAAEAALAYPKVIPSFNMLSLPATPLIIEQLAQDNRVEKIYSDRLMYAFQTVPDEGIYYDPLNKLNFTTTYWTRKLLGLEEANAEGWTGKGVTVAVVDSVPGYSPVIIKNASKFIEIIPIEDLWNGVEGETVVTESGEEIKEVKGIQVYYGRGGTSWTRVERIIRHPYDGKLLRINARGGIVDVSPNHSIIVGNHSVDAKLVRKGDQIVIPGINVTNKYQYLFIGTEDLAWLYGFFSAEGSACIMKEAYLISLTNNDESLLEKAEKIFKENFYLKMAWDRSTKTRKIYCSNKSIYTHFREAFYTSDGKKKIPPFILNSPKNVKLAFLRGYNAGDGGHQKNISWEFQSFTTNSQTLAMGLILSLQEVSDQSFRVYARDDKPSIIQIGINQNSNSGNRKEEVKNIGEISYSGFLYDLVTKNHVFCTGVGPIRVHNTGAGVHQQIPIVERRTVMTGQYSDGSGHGTYCATTIAGRETMDTAFRVPVAGMAPDVILVSIKSLGYVIGVGKESDVLKGMELAASRGANIINFSLGSDNVPANPEDDPQTEVIKKLTREDIVCVVAAGNTGKTQGSICSPGVAPDALTVGGFDELTGQIPDFSSRGPTPWGDVKPDVVGPAVRVDSGTVNLLDLQGDKRPQRFSYLCGTSISAPHIAGVIACAKQMFNASGILLDAPLVKEICSTYSGREKTNDDGWGLLKFSYFKKYLQEH